MVLCYQQVFSLQPGGEATGFFFCIVQLYCDIEGVFKCLFYSTMDLCYERASLQQAGEESDLRVLWCLCLFFCKERISVFYEVLQWPIVLYSE